jgi:hypothetical protein
MECFTVRYGSKIHKRGYDTKKLALQALGNSARKWNWDKSQMNVYKCKKCRKWHFGRKVTCKKRGGWLTQARA